MHDPRIGRFFATDPLEAKYSYYSPYQFSGNRLIDCVELEGLEPKNVTYFNMIDDGQGNSVPDKDNARHRSSLRVLSNNAMLRNIYTGKLTPIEAKTYGPQDTPTGVYTYWENGKISKQVVRTLDNSLDGDGFKGMEYGDFGETGNVLPRFTKQSNTELEGMLDGLGNSLLDAADNAILPQTKIDNRTSKEKLTDFGMSFMDVVSGGKITQMNSEIAKLQGDYYGAGYTFGYSIPNYVSTVASFGSFASFGSGLSLPRVNWFGARSGAGPFGLNGLKIGGYRLDIMYANPRGGAGAGTFFSLRSQTPGGFLLRWDYGKLHGTETMGVHSTFRYNFRGSTYGSSGQFPWHAPYTPWKYRRQQ